MELSGARNDMLSSIGNPSLDTRVRLGETLETFHKLGKIGSVLDFDGDLHDRGHGELHDPHVVGSFGSGESTALEQELIDTDETNNVTGRAILNRLDVATHHEYGALNRLDEQVFLLSRNIVGSLDADLGTSTNGSREDTAKCIEAALIGCGNHLGDVEYERALGITVTDTDC